MENLDNNSYIKILSENTENKKETYINFLDATNLKDSESTRFIIKNYKKQLLIYFGAENE